jgi:non-heme chloroperoxidase
LLHGWAQDSRCWGPQVFGALAREHRVLALDLRGHGYSDAPALGYDDPASWAGDVHAVLAAEGVSSGAVLVGWSYGGLVIGDYLSVFGDDALAGVALVGAVTSMGRGQAGGRVGPAMRAAIPGAMSERTAQALRALGAFGTAMTGPPAGKGPQSQAFLGRSLCTPPRVREACFAREISHDAELRALSVPLLAIHGAADPVVDASSARHAAELAPRGRLSLWEGAQHAPFVEDPERFSGELLEFAAGLGPDAPRGA